jgi:hypothetical protein
MILPRVSENVLVPTGRNNDTCVSMSYSGSIIAPRRFQLSETTMGVAAIEMRGGVLRCDGDRSIAGGDRLGRPAW